MDENTILTASSDGIIRALGIMPHRLVGVCGVHGDMPVERIRTTWDGQWVGSCSHDQTVKFWAADGIEDESEKGEGGDGSDEEAAGSEVEETGDDSDADEKGSGDSGSEQGSITKAASGPGPVKRAKEESSDDSDDSDQEEKVKTKKKRRKAKRGIGIGKPKKSMFSGLD